MNGIGSGQGREINDQYARDGCAEFAMWKLLWGDAADLLTVEGEGPPAYDCELNDITAKVKLTMQARLGDASVGGAEDKLPRGTRQRIAIARALVDKPRVLLFDEANSFIDGAGDEMLRDLLIKLSGRVTLVMVTQRPSMLEITDRIFDISSASVVERQPPPEPDQAPAEHPEAT